MHLRSLICWVLLAVVGVGYTAPIPAGARAYTARQLLDVKLKFYHRTICEAYQAVGVHDAAWDAAAQRYLEAYVKNTAEAPDAPTLAELTTLGRVAVEAGCSDPQVLYCYATELQQNKQLVQAEELLKRALEGFRTSKYPRCRAQLAPIRLTEVGSALGTLMPEQFDEYRKLGIAWAAESLSDGSYGKGEERLFLDQLLERWNQFYEHHLPELYTALSAQPNVDPYVLQVVDGQRHIQEGWEARGDGYANTVTDAGWKGFDTHLKQAYTALHEAWKLRPELPEAPYLLIQVAMADHTPENETARLWFDRAVKAQLDYLPAYTAYVWNLYPRWGGSLAAMYQVGEECLATGRFDTEVPAYFLRVLTDLTDEYGGVKTAYTNPKTYPYLVALFDGYAKAQPKQADWYRSLKAAGAAYCGKLADARKMLDVLGPRFDKKAFARYSNTPVELSLGEIYAKTGAWAAQLQGAEASWSAGKAADAAARCAKVVSAPKQDLRALPYLKARMLTFQRRAQFDKGDWVDIQPTATFAGWKQLRGEWSVEPDGAVCGVSKNDGLLLMCQSEFGTKVEVQGEVEFVKSEYSNFNGAVTLAGNGEGSNDFYAVCLFKTEQQLSLRDGFEERAATTAAANVKDKSTFHIQLWQNELTVTVNDDPIERGVAMKSTYDAPHYLGIGGNYWYPAATLRFRHLQVRKLSGKPKE